MCGRYTLATSANFKKRFGIFGDIPKIGVSYNISPSTYNPVIIRNSPNRIVMMKWGFIPQWSKDNKFTLINIRKETLLEKPYFQKILMSARCLIPADGFYEWKKVNLEGYDERIPYYIQLANHATFSFAGLYSILSDAEGKSIYTYAIITCPPNNAMKTIHNRMPVIIDAENEETWLEQETENVDKLSKLLIPFENTLRLYPVGKKVNNPVNDGPYLIKSA